MPKPIDPVAGHIPGAENTPFESLLGADGRLLSTDEIGDRCQSWSSEPQVVHYCGSGVTACFNLLAAEAAGLGTGVLYPGSWSGWISDPKHSVATGSSGPKIHDG